MIGSYEIVGRLGRGGMATVYKARAPYTDRLVALKVLQPREEIFVDLVGWQQLKRAFIGEAKLMASLHHPHIAGVLDCGEDGDLPYVVMEYYSHSLGGVIGEGYSVEEPSRILGVATVHKYLRQLLQGVQRLHGAGVVHRDLKPYNLMLAEDAQLKIIDFGLSRVRGEELLAVPGMQIGSPYYTAPELGRSGGDYRADLYSIGVLALRMLTGTLFDLKGDAEILSSLPQPWQRWIGRALAPVDSRYCSAEEMLVDLEALPLHNYPKRSCLLSSSGCLSNDRQVRSQAKRILYKDIGEELGLDSLLRPRSCPCLNLQMVGELLVQAPSLLWQRRGSGYAMNRQQADEYINRLNAEKWQGRASWRLPTTEELLTITPRSGDALACHRQNFADFYWLWSADYSTKKADWAVDFREGYFERLDKDGAAAVCAVSSDL